MTRAADALAGLLARLGPAGMQHHGKPAKRAPARRSADAVFAESRRIVYGGERGTATLRPFTGSLHPARCGATQTQTRSMRLDVETSTDLAGALAAVVDRLDYQLVLWTVLHDWRNDVDAMRVELTRLLVEKSLRSKWRMLASPNPDDVPEKHWYPIVDKDEFLITMTDGVYLPAIVGAVLDELRHADACSRCNSLGKVLELKPAPQWIACIPCMGTGRLRIGLDRRAKRIGIRKSRFKEHDARHAYDWLLKECNGRLALAAQQIQDARGRWEE